MSHTTAEIRAALFNRKLKMLPVDWVIDGLEDFTGELAVIELKATDSRWAEQAAKLQDDTSDETLTLAGIVIKGLILKETKERVFADNDLESVASMGLSVLKPINDLISEASGASADSLANAKKNYQKILANASATSSPQNSEATETLTPSLPENVSAT